MLSSSVLPYPALLCRSLLFHLGHEEVVGCHGSVAYACCRRQLGEVLCTTPFECWCWRVTSTITSMDQYLRSTSGHEDSLAAELARKVMSDYKHCGAEFHRTTACYCGLPGSGNVSRVQDSTLLTGMALFKRPPTRGQEAVTCS